jgi:phenylacetic acid degradation operon negative regulatory protein
MPKSVQPMVLANHGGSRVPDVGGRTAVELVTTLGGLTLDPQLGGFRGRRFAARVPLSVLGQLGIAPNAIRLALARHVRLGLLSSTKVGRVVVYSITGAAERVFAEAGLRMRGTNPLASTSTVWTLVSFSVPESRRDLRSRLRIHLTQCGFRPLRDGLWVTLEPFAADRVMRDLDPDLPENAQLDVFIGTPYLSTGLAQMIRRSWDVDDLRLRHEQFLARWEHVEPPEDQALAMLTLFTADWIKLLHHDPGLPADSLDRDWPGDRSTATATRLYATLKGPAGSALDQLMRTSDPTAHE